MAGFNDATLLRDTTQDLVNGMNRDGLGAMADKVCTRLTHRSLKGTDPRRDTKDTLPRDAGGQAVGATPRERGHELASDDWTMLQYDHGFSIVIQQAVDAGQYMDPLKEFLETARADVNMQIDADFAALLGAETNTQAAANGNWSVAATSTPGLDIQQGIKTYVPEAFKKGSEYVGVIGLQTALELGRHTSFLASSTQYAASLDSLDIADDFAPVRLKLAGLTGIPANNWMIGDQFYDANGANLAVSLSYLLGDFLWVGKKSHLRMREQPRGGVDQDNLRPEDYGFVTVDSINNRQTIHYYRTLAMFRQDSQLAFRVTGL